MTMLKRLSPIAAAIALMITALFVVVPQPASAATTGLTAKQVVAQMGAGWNLGNTLDATGSGLSAETSWGNPKTTKAMIDAVKAEGFNTVRIPVSWGRHTSGKDYTIDTAWMNRVQEIVDYCIDDGMFVILNIHHDNDKAYFYPNSTYRTQSINYIKSIWKQVSARFKNYDQHLVFEIMNEPRLVGDGNHEWWFPVNSPDSVVSDAIKVINELNQTAVDVIRASGGNNAQRCIMIPGYCASIDGCTTPNFKLPTDSAKDRLIVSVHAYTPYNFCLNGSGTAVFSDSLKSEVDYLFDTINNKFLTKGIPVVIGETSASNKNNASERLKWVDYFYGKAASYGVPCVLWDNNAYTNPDKGEAHGHLDRNALKWYDKSFVDRIVSYFPTSKDVANATVSAISDKTYTGAAIKPAVTVKLNGVTLKSGTDYTVSYSNNVNIGTASVTITGKGDYTGKKTVKFGIVPKNVTGLYLKGRAYNALRIAWNKSTTAAGYIIEQKSGNTWKRVGKIVGNTTTEYRISGLKAGTAYTFRVRGYKTVSGKSLYSTGAQCTYRTDPSAIKGFTLKGRAADALRIGWTKNTSADGYIIEQLINGKWTRIKKITDENVTEYRIAGLKEDTKYSFRVRAYKMSGTTALYSGYTSGYWYTNPRAVSGFSVKKATKSEITLTWSKTKADGVIIEQYSNGKWVKLIDVKNTYSSCRIPALKSKTSYQFRITAYNKVGNKTLYSVKKTLTAKTL